MMKLDQKQMHTVSQLFMAASKAGQTFDLGRFTKDPNYASETVAKLALLAEQKQHEPLRALVSSTMDLLANVTVPAPSAAAATFASPSVSPFQESTNAQQYVGKLR